MAARARRLSGRTEYWPSFVDVLTNLLLVFVFLLSIFALMQFLLSREVSTKDEVMARLNAQIAELTELLALERAGSGEVNENLATLEAGLSAAESERDRLRGLLDSQADATNTAGDRVAQLTAQLEDQTQVGQRALAQVELLNQQISALRRQIAALEDALGASETRDRESQTKIADLGRRLNVALAQRVQELSRYRSDFFGRLREILGDRPDIRIVGDRFVFQSEVFFGKGEAAISPEGRDELDKLASAMLQLVAEIPGDLNWVLRVDGHTDADPINTFQFPSNWELSTARAISVVRYLVSRGVPPHRLVAAGFGEFQPIDTGAGEESNRKNRRIELKLTER
jgi:chemotaxis protein MotB